MAKQGKYDITVFGSTGFTGELTALYLAKKQIIENFSLGIAGRDQKKLNLLKEKILQENPKSNVEIVVADIHNYTSLLEMCKQTKNLITTVGPYVEYGEDVVKACIEGESNYLDLTGEGKFVFEMSNRYQKSALEKKVKIINCCGFDSIPADLGTYFTVTKLPSNEAIEIECFVSVNGPGFESVSGGTWHSALGILSSNEMERQKISYTSIQSKAGFSRIVSPIPLQIRLREENKTYGLPLPFIDIEVVLRSAAELQEYGPNFSYGHYAAIPNTFMLIGSILGAGALFGLSQFEFTRNLLKELKKPGEGPKQEVREKTNFELSFIGKSKSKIIKTKVTGGDPGYGDTSKMLAESALCLLKDKIPERYGFITPSISMGNLLIQRLDSIGIHFKEII